MLCPVPSFPVDTDSVRISSPWSPWAWVAFGRGLRHTEKTCGRFRLTAAIICARGVFRFFEVTAVNAVCGAIQTARRRLDVDNKELAWTVRAYHGSDDVRGPGEKRKPAKCAARCLARGSDVTPESVDLWPGAKAAS